jgi:hypothetical protein
MSMPVLLGSVENRGASGERFAAPTRKAHTCAILYRFSSNVPFLELDYPLKPV